MIECTVCENQTNFKSKFKILFECQNCGHIFADVKINFSDVQKLYSDDYFFGNEYIDYINDRNSIEKNAIVRNKVINKYVKKNYKNNIFEI